MRTVPAVRRLQVSSHRLAVLRMTKRQRDKRRTTRAKTDGRLTMRPIPRPTGPGPEVSRGEARTSEIYTHR